MLNFDQNPHIFESTMNLQTDHPLKDAELAKLNNPLGNAREPVFLFIFKAKVTTNQKIQVKD